jgi:hypothetical protein
MKNSNDTIGNRTRDLPTCSAVLQQTASLRARVLAVESPEPINETALTLTFSLSWLGVVPPRICTASGSTILWDGDGNKFGCMDSWGLNPKRLARLPQMCHEDYLDVQISSPTSGLYQHYLFPSIALGNSA